MNRMYFACWGLHYGIENQTLIIDDEPSKALQNSKCNVLFIESLRGYKLSKNKVQWLDLASYLWPSWLHCCRWGRLASIMKSVKYPKPQLTSLSNYFYFMQYMKSHNGESGITQLPLGMYSSYAWSKLIYCVFVFHLWIIFTYPIIEFHLQVVWIIVYEPHNDVCSSQG